MAKRQTWEVIHRIYDGVQMALWALLCAFVLYLVIFILPHVTEIRAEIESQELLQISAENRFYCEKWGMHEGTPEYLQCTLDLQTIRAKVEQRIAADTF